MNYPSRIITMGERDSDLVKQIQSRINELLCGPIAVDGIMEVPPRSNRGPTVSAYLRSVGLPPSNPWCAAFVYWCFEQSSVKDPSLIEPGLIFILDRGHGKGHTGIVTDYRNGYITTIEGNANALLSTEGSGVVSLVRKIESINVGFIKYDCKIILQQ